MIAEKGKIDEKGMLYIQRKNRMQKAICPFYKMACADLCALFGEPEYDKKNNGDMIKATLKLACMTEGTSWEFCVFEDLRK